MANTLPLPVGVEEGKLPRITVLYGEYGAGKTTLATSILYDPAYRPGVVLNADKGLESVAHLANELEFMQVNLKDTKEVRLWADQFILPPERRIEKYRNVKTVIVDSAVALRDNLMQSIAQDRADHPKTEYDNNPFGYQMQDYGWATNATAYLINVLRQGDLNIIITAGEKLMPDGFYTFDVNEALRRVLSRDASNIWYVSNTGSNNALLTRNKGAYRTKTRNPVLAEKLRKLSIAGVPSEQVAAREGWIRLPFNKETFKLEVSLAELLS